MSKKASRKKGRTGRRVYSDELKAEAVQMLLDGHSAESVASNLGLSGVGLALPLEGQAARAERTGCRDPGESSASIGKRAPSCRAGA